jgi:hypothetical protein
VPVAAALELLEQNVRDAVTTSPAEPSSGSS